jgi:hypothetical protein
MGTALVALVAQHRVVVAVEGREVMLVSLLIVEMAARAVVMAAAVVAKVEQVLGVVLAREALVWFVLCGVKAVLAVHHRFLQPM